MAMSGRYGAIRRATERLCEPLQTEDFVVQSMAEASPVRWHLAHTTWFFETFVLARAVPGFRSFDPEFGRLFNSYYQSVGEPLPKETRGLLDRKSTRLNSSHSQISYAVFCLKKKKQVIRDAAVQQVGVGVA